MSDKALSINKLLQVALPCADITQSRLFYEEVLGAKFIAEFDPPGLLFFQLGDARLLLERSTDKSESGTVLYFEVPKIKEAFSTLQAKGVEFESDPQLVHTDSDGLFGEPGHEEWMAFFRDPDANILALVSKVTKASAS
ncbi:MAG: VOC family protein [Pseudomonadales bacterium]